MPYNNTPFNFYGTQTDQVKIDLDNANNNFTILANAFKDNSPDTGIVKNADAVGGFTPSQTPTPNAIPVAKSDGKIDAGWLPPISGGSSSCVDLTNASSDYNLSVGECAIINFTNATSVPLHIATQDGTVYEMFITPFNNAGTSGGSGNPAFLNPNNTTYSNAFDFAEVFRNINTGSSMYDTYSAFRVGWSIYSAYIIITNKTTYKNVKGFCNIYGTSSDLGNISVYSCVWKDTTTVWSSLGTLIFPQSTTGQILVRRIV